MPFGGRRTHDFPHGRPFFLTFIEIAFAILLIISGISFGFENLRSAAPTVALLVAYVVTYSLVIRRYERTGEAVRRRTVNVMVRFPEGFPAPLLAVRAFLVVVGLMLTFGVGPFRFEVAKNGIIGCVFALVAVAVVNVLLERHYMKIGQATEVEFSTKLGK
jgi:hypothetical protein